MGVYYSGHISGSFEGFNEGKIFKLDNGTYWIQSEYEYDYMYEYEPEAIISESCGTYYLLIGDKKVAVEQLYDVIESRIDGNFEGWDEDKVYKLENGEVWQQSSYHYEYHYAYSPEAFIYSHNGTTYMQVDGTKAEVKKIGPTDSDYSTGSYGSANINPGLSYRDSLEYLAMSSQFENDHSVSIEPSQSTRKQSKKRPSRSLSEAIEDIGDVIGGIFKFLLFVAFILFGFWLYKQVEIPDKPEEHPGEIRIDHSSIYYKWQNYYDTIIELRDKGFNDIRITPLNDLKTGIFPKSGIIKTIEVNGESYFYSHKLVSEQSVVSITYHSFTQKEKNGFVTEKNNHAVIYGIDFQLPNYLIEDYVNDTLAVYHVKNDEESKLLFFNCDEQVIKEIETFDTYYLVDSRDYSSSDIVEKEIEILGKKNDKVYSVCLSKLQIKNETIYIMLVSPDNCKTDYSSDYRAILSNIYVPQDTEIQIDFNLKDYKGKSYEDVVAELKNKGFRNIQIENLKDVVLGVITKEGVVETVTINGSSDYKVGDWIDEQAEIFITYHGKK